MYRNIAEIKDMAKIIKVVAVKNWISLQMFYMDYIRRCRIVHVDITTISSGIF